jgi:hypothetical protein
MMYLPESSSHGIQSTAREPLSETQNLDARRSVPEVQQSSSGLDTFDRFSQTAEVLDMNSEDDRIDEDDPKYMFSSEEGKLQDNDKIQRPENSRSLLYLPESSSLSTQYAAQDQPGKSNSLNAKSSSPNTQTAHLIASSVELTRDIHVDDIHGRVSSEPEATSRHLYQFLEYNGMMTTPKTTIDINNYVKWRQGWTMIIVNGLSMKTIAFEHIGSHMLRKPEAEYALIADGHVERYMRRHLKAKRSVEVVQDIEQAHLNKKNKT